MDVSSIYGEPFAIQIKMVSNQISFDYIDSFIEQIGHKILFIEFN